MDKFLNTTITFLRNFYYKCFNKSLSRIYSHFEPFYSLIAIADSKKSSSHVVKRIHESIIESFKNINGKLNIDFDFFYKDRTNENKWITENNNLVISSHFDSRISAALDGNTFVKLSGDHPLITELNSLKPSRKYKYGIIFTLQNLVNYLIITSRLSDDIIKFFNIIQFVISQLDLKFQLMNKNDLQKFQIETLEQRLNENQLTLKQTERSLKKRVYEINNLLEISNELYSELNLKRLINIALLTIIGQIRCQKSIALIYDTSTNSYSNVTMKGIAKEDLQKIDIEVDHPVVRFFLEKQQPIKVVQLLKIKNLKEIAQQLKPAGIELLSPIIHSDRLKGIIGCGEKLYGQELDDSDIQIFTILVNILSVSLSNAQIYEEVKQMSFTDGMTGLNNYRYFEDRLKEELNRAKRNKSSLSLIMLDIDHFKNYNDTLGHQAGDEALRMLAWILKSTVRDDDIVNRYGGEEFSIILPGMEKKSIQILAERIREKVEEHPFYKEHVQPQGKITISLGAATFPDDADTFDSLISKADKALYKAKGEGRNKFILYTEAKIKSKEKSTSS
ncbi:MAG: sensor domain-containing diguanylate cyclase [Calditrichaceae bacterium]|nr:sensor domain-containing diguanylate cyclase [Calditrichaceae bacterium]